jgi:hypothetical protein
MGKANLYSLFFAIPAAIILTSAYLVLWGKSGFIDARITISRNFLLSIVIVLLGVLLHELIHGLSWAWFGKKPLSAIKYGINLKALAPYAHCNQPLDIRAYRLGAIMPGLLLGVLPAILGIVSGAGEIMIFGLLFTVAAGGDAMILWLLRNEKSGIQVMDHSVNAGCYIIDSEKETTMN